MLDPSEFFNFDGLRNSNVFITSFNPVNLLCNCAKAVSIIGKNILILKLSSVTFNRLSPSTSSTVERPYRVAEHHNATKTNTRRHHQTHLESIPRYRLRRNNAFQGDPHPGHVVGEGRLDKACVSRTITRHAPQRRLPVYQEHRGRPRPLR